MLFFQLKPSIIFWANLVLKVNLKVKLFTPLIAKPINKTKSYINQIVNQGKMTKNEFLILFFWWEGTVFGRFCKNIFTYNYIIYTYSEDWISNCQLFNSVLTKDKSKLKIVTKMQISYQKLLFEIGSYQWVEVTGSNPDLWNTLWNPFI